MNKGIVISFFLSSLFLYSLIFNINKPLSLLHGDAFLVNFILKHWMSVIFSGNWSQLPTLPMLYGFEKSLFFTDHHFIHFLLSLPLFMITRDIITTTNLYVVATIIASFIAMYMLVWHFTRHVFASVFAGIVFVFNPFIFARFPDHLILLSLQWIPLFFLFFERSAANPTSKNLFLFFFFLTCQLLSSLYYSVFLTVILPIYILTRLLQKHLSIRKFLNRGAVAGLLLFLITCALSGYWYYRVHKDYHIERTIDQAVPQYAARPSDYFFTASQNLLYGGLKEKAVAAFPSFVRLGIYSEHNLFWGIVPLTLFILSFFILRKSPHRPLWLVCTGLLALSFLLSLGPKIVVTDTLTIPGLYGLFYTLNPLFSFLRTAARFGVFVFFFLALIAALSLTEIEKRLSKKKAMIVPLLLIFLVFFEYWNKPLEFYQVDPQTTQFYEVLGEQRQIRVILDYPIGNLIPYPYPQARAEDFDAHYLLYATIFHDKKLFNGYTGFLPQAYYERGNYLSVHFPTREKLKKLKEWEVDGIILHKNEFTNPHEFDRIKAMLLERNVPEVMSTKNLSLFDLTVWEQN